MKKFTAILLSCLLLISTLSAVSFSAEDIWLAEDPPFFTQKIIAELKSGYWLIYLDEMSPPWTCEFSYQYGNYIFTNYNGESEKQHGFYLLKDNKQIMLSEAFEKGITDIEEVVSAVKDNAPELYNYRIFSIEDAEKLVKERYNRNTKLEYVGIMYADYYLFYENNLERALVEWELNFEFGDYVFQAFGGHTGNNEPEALGLYVLHNGKILNIKEAIDEIPDSVWSEDFYDLVKLINSKDINYSFKVKHKSDIEETSAESEPVETTLPTETVEPTVSTDPFSGMDIEPYTVTIPNPTEPETTLPEIIEHKTTEPVEKANPIKVTAKVKTVKAKKLKTKKRTVKPLSVKNAKGSVKIVKVKNGTASKIYKKITVNKNNGAITLKKGDYKKGTYKIKLKISAKGNSIYKGKTLNKTVKIRII